MAKLRSGILGNLRGKVAGVVGSQWKDVNYIREYVKPANPQSAAQVVQRDLMKNCVEFCKPLVGAVFNEYTDRFQKSMSGFNRFIKTNIAEFVASPTYTSVKVTEGKLSPIANLTFTYNTADGACIFGWDENLGNNGDATDEVYWCFRDKSTGIWYYADGVKARDDEADTQTIKTGLTPANLCAYILVAQKTSGIVTSIGNSDAQIATAP